MFLLRKDSILIFSLFLGAKAAHANVIVDGNVSATSNQVNRDVGDVPGNKFFGDVNLDVKQSNDIVQSRFTFASRNNDAGLFMYSVQEAYVQTRGAFRKWDYTSKTGDLFRVGRQILPWSTVDEHWGLGKLNNRRNFDFLEPGQEGLVGLNYETHGKNFFAKIFGSGVYVPESNPTSDIDKKNKTITTRHPWSDPPAASADVEGNPTPIQYIVDYPQINEVIWRYSAGAQLGYKNEHWLFETFYMRKPENVFSTQVEVALAADAKTVKAFIKPQFYYHDVYGGNIKWKNKDVEVYASAIGIRPNTFPDGSSQATNYTEIKTKKLPEAYGSFGITRSNDVYSLGLGYIARLSPYDRDKDTLVQDPRWNQAVNVFLMRKVSRSFSVSADVKYDMLTTDRLLMVRAGYNVSKMLLITAGVNMIGTPNDGKSFWSPYTNNDAVLVGLRLIF